MSTQGNSTSCLPKQHSQGRYPVKNIKRGNGLKNIAENNNRTLFKMDFNLFFIYPYLKYLFGRHFVQGIQQGSCIGMLNPATELGRTKYATFHSVKWANVCVGVCLCVCVCSSSRSLSLMPLRMHARACTFDSYVHVST